MFGFRAVLASQIYRGPLSGNMEQSKKKAQRSGNPRLLVLA